MAKFGEWIEIKTRPLSEEEMKEYEDESEWYEFIYDCELPDDGQEILVQLRYGMAITTFYTDMGCYFENYEDEDDVVAWMPLPSRYVKENKSVLPTIKEKDCNNCANATNDFNNEVDTGCYMCCKGLENNYVPTK